MRGILSKCQNGAYMEWVEAIFENCIAGTDWWKLSVSLEPSLPFEASLSLKASVWLEHSLRLQVSLILEASEMLEHLFIVATFVLLGVVSLRN